MEDAEHDLEFVVRDFLISKGNVTEADTRYKSYQADFRTAEEKLKSLKEYGEGLVIEHSKLELDLADRNNSIIENSVNHFCHLPDNLRLKINMFSGEAH